MIVDTKKFPFKWMPTIIKILKNHQFITLFQISRKLGSCFADASESTRMLYYLTCLGKVVGNSNNEWKIIHTAENLPQLTKYRFKYVQDLKKLVQSLNGTFKNVSDLVVDKAWKEKDIQEALRFLSLVTERGFLYFEGDGHRQKWILKKWPVVNTTN
ncbi:MAG: hypothetical protein ACFE95_06630 [Candidatus Hodarchaeota archaeon]